MDTTPAITDREHWLTEAAQFIIDDLISPHLSEQPQHPFRVSVGFPSGKPSKVLAQCWKAEASADSTNEIFVSPIEDDSAAILASLTHELVHYSDNCESGHKGHFARVARAIGLEGKLTATTAGPELAEQLASYVEILGEIPHAKIDVAKSGVKKQGSRMIKVCCERCEFSFRTTQKHIDAMHADNPGHRACPVCGTIEGLAAQ